MAVTQGPNPVSFGGDEDVVLSRETAHNHGRRADGPRRSRSPCHLALDDPAYNLDLAASLVADHWQAFGGGSPRSARWIWSRRHTTGARPEFGRGCTERLRCRTRPFATSKRCWLCIESATSNVRRRSSGSATASTEGGTLPVPLGDEDLLVRYYLERIRRIICENEEAEVVRGHRVGDSLVSGLICA
jgi:hypothetical protein